jgi:Zn-dependent M28 family amino/carboxypeptidase
MRALAAVGSRDPRHPGHAQAVGYIKDRLAAVPGVRVESHRAVYQGIPLENILATIDPADASPTSGWIVIAAHYDSIAVRTSGWRPASDPAPGADDNATGTAALLEYARLIAAGRSTVGAPSLPFLRQRVVLAFFDGEELFFKGSAAYLQSLPKPYPIAAVVNIDMVGFNPMADRLDLIWYGAQSDDLRDRVKAANERYRVGVQLVEVFADERNQLIVDSAPFGLAGIPAVSLVERYGPPDATYPGNPFFHTVNDTPANIGNRGLWLKAAKLTLATALELARFE